MIALGIIAKRYVVSGLVAAAVMIGPLDLQSPLACVASSPGVIELRTAYNLMTGDLATAARLAQQTTAVAEKSKTETAAPSSSVKVKNLQCSLSEQASGQRL